jgi:hypothetical protein
MPVLSIITQPVPSKLMAAYRPILIRASTQATGGSPKPPVVYCDIYFGGVFYKTLSKTQFSKLNPTSSEWEFDIQDAAQEYLKKYIADNGLSLIIEVPQVMTKCFCKIRSSGINTRGFIQTEDVAPVQGTGSTAPISGTGTLSNTFFILNSTLQHEDNQDLAGHLTAFKRRTWSPDAFPLTHRPDRYELSSVDSDFFPIVYTGADIPASLVLNYRYRNQSTWRTAVASSVIACPNVSNLQTGLVDNGDGTQTIFFTYDPLPGLVTSFVIGYRQQGSTGAFTTQPFAINATAQVTLPTGLYEFQFTTTGACVTAPRTVENIGVPAVPCTAITIIGTPALPDAAVGVAYSYTIYLSGSAPFSLTNIVKPSWMNIAVSGSSIVFSGTPSATATAVPVSMRIENCFSASHQDFSDSIDVVQQSNNVVVLISPGNMDINFSPANCWQWTGTVSIRQAVTNALIGTQTYNSHTDPSQNEVWTLSGIANGNYYIEWDLQSVQNCSNVGTEVEYIEDYGIAQVLGPSDTHTFSLSANTTKQIQLIVDNV